jgi:hypothetical protein
MVTWLAAVAQLARAPGTGMSQVRVLSGAAGTTLKNAARRPDVAQWAERGGNFEVPGPNPGIGSGLHLFDDLKIFEGHRVREFAAEVGIGAEKSFQIEQGLPLDCNVIIGAITITHEVPNLIEPSDFFMQLFSTRLEPPPRDCA